MAPTTTPQVPADADFGEVLGGRYRLLEQIGRGAFSVVHRASDVTTGRFVAVKLLASAPSPDAGNPGQSLDDFREEVKLGASIAHRGIAGLRDAGATPDGRRFAVYDFVEGKSLRERLDHGPVLGRDVLLRLLAEVLDALGAAHVRGVVHRDLKPENILVASEGLLEHAVLVDFGLGAVSDREAKSSANRSMVGTPRYAAPEQLRGEPPTPRADLYAWGLIAIECLGGRSPIVAETAHDAVREQLDTAPVAIPAALEPLAIASLLRRMTAKDPADRPADAAQALHELAQVAGDVLGLASRSASPADKVTRNVTIVSCRFAAPDDATDAGDLLLQAASEQCAEFFAAAGATVLSTVGNRVVVGFGLRHDDPNHARRGVSAAVDWLEGDETADGRFRRNCAIGVHSGEAQLDRVAPASLPPRGVSGALTATALGLDTVVRPGRVAVSEATREWTDEEWSFTPIDAELQPGSRSFQLRRRRGALRTSAVAGPASMFAGRAPERKVLADAWTDAAAGRPRAVLVRGEAGIGKSRVVRELRNDLPETDWIEARCAPEQQASSFGALRQLLSSLDAGAGRLVSRYGLDPEVAVPIVAGLLGEALPDGYAIPAATPDRLKELTHGLAIELLLAMAADEPVVVLIEDLQWADIASLELISRLLDRCGASAQAGEELRLLVLLTARPDFASPWREDAILQVNLAELDAADVEKLIAARAGEAGTRSAEVLRRAVAACRGVPLFAEEAAFLLQAASDTGGPDATAMPESVDSLLRARMKSLSPRALEFACAAAAVGREFRLDVVESICGAAGSCLRELIEAGLVVAVDDRPRTYAFRHALLRDAAYEELDERSRPSLHLRIGKAMREQFPELAIERPADVALHFEKGGEAMAAAELWHQAGTSAMATASYLEAQKLFDRGIRTISAAPASLGRAQRELGLTTGLATAHLSVEGYGAAVTREKFARARLLCTELGLEAPLAVLGGIFGASLVTSDNEGMSSLLPVFESLAARTESPVHAVAGHQMLGVHGFWSGRYRQGRLHSLAAMELYRRPWVRDTSWEFGFGLYCYAYGMISEYQLGFPDRAEAIRVEMLGLAAQSRNPYTLALALGFGTTVTKDCGRPAATMDLATRLLAMSAEQHLYIWYAFGTLAQGSALLQLGQSQDALVQIRAGLSMLDTFGFRCSFASYQTYLVEALLACGELDEALEVADKGLEMYRTEWTRFSEPDMKRLRGEVLEARGDDEGAEREYRRAMEIARGDEGMTYELRAATTLAQLLARRGDRSAALVALEQVYSRFTEGFSTQDLVRAASLIGELRRGS